MTTNFASSTRHRAALLNEWSRLTILVEMAEKNPETKAPELVALWRQLMGLCSGQR